MIIMTESQNIKIKSKYLKSAIELCSKLNPDIYIYQDKDAIVFQCIQEGNSSLIECVVKANIKKSEDIMFFPISKLKNILNASNEDDIIEFMFNEEYITFILKNMNRKIRTYVPDKPRFVCPDERLEKPLIFENELNVFADELLNPLIASNDIIAPLNIEIKNKLFTLKKEDKTDTFSAIIKNSIFIKNEKSVNNIYNSDFVYNVMAKSKDKINIKVSQDTPIKFTNELYRNLTFKYMVAPLVAME